MPGGWLEARSVLRTREYWTPPTKFSGHGDSESRICAPPY